MENFAPGLREGILTLTETLRVVLFFVCVAGFMLHINRARAEQESLARPLVRAAVIVGLIAGLPQWFGFTERIFLSAADVVNAGYTEHPMRTAEKMRASVADSETDFSFRRIGESLYKASLWAAAKLVVLVGSLLQLPFHLLQYLLKWLCYLFLPLALAVQMVPSLASLGTRYVQQTLAVLAWPVGFAITELVAYHLLTAYQANLAAAYGLTPGEIDAASFGSLLGGLLAALWIVVGTLSTPFLMQMLFCSGSPISGGGQSALQQLYMIQHLGWMARMLKTGGAAAPATATSAATNSGTGGSGPTIPPPPPPPAPVNPPASAPPPPRSDPAGDGRAAAVLAQAQLPASQTAI